MQEGAKGKPRTWLRGRDFFGEGLSIGREGGGEKAFPVRKEGNFPPQGQTIIIGDTQIEGDLWRDEEKCKPKLLIQGKELTLPDSEEPRQRTEEIAG